MALTYPVAQHRLANGLRVLASADHTVPAVTIALHYDVGSLHEELASGFTPGEHAAATESLSRTLPLSYETPAALTQLTADLAACGLRPGYPGVLLDDIAVLTPRQVSGAYRRHILPERLTLVAVGDAARLTGPFQKILDPLPLQVITS